MNVRIMKNKRGSRVALIRDGVYFRPSLLLEDSRLTILRSCENIMTEGEA